MADAVYLGNPNLKKTNTAINFTKKQVAEFIKCKDDPVYFTRNYIKIVSLDEGLVPFKMWDFQEQLIENFHKERFNIAKASSTDRQVNYGCLLSVALCSAQ